MLGVRFRPCCYTIVCSVGIIVATPGSGVTAGPNLSKITCDSLVDVLRDRERLVRTASCTFVVRQTPIAAAAIPRIRAISEKRHDPWGGRSFIITEEIARISSKTIRWRGDGRLERYETYASPEDARIGTAAAQSITTFDGQVVRSLSPNDKPPRGRISDPVAAHWDQGGEVGGYSLIYKYHGSYLSGLLQRSNDARLTAGNSKGERDLTVTFTHPDFKEHTFKLVFDDHLRLRRRSYILQIRGYDEAPRLYEMDELDDYRSYKDKSGTVIEFPHKATYHYFAGDDLVTKTPVEYTSQQITVSDVEFNAPMPKQLFAIEFPKNAKIYDGLTGQDAQGVAK
jgi:hypothetical protein